MQIRFFLLVISGIAFVHLLELIQTSHHMQCFYGANSNNLQRVRMQELVIEMCVYIDVKKKITLFWKSIANNKVVYSDVTPNMLRNVIWH